LTDLEDQLSALGTAVEWPPTPDLLPTLWADRPERLRVLPEAQRFNRWAYAAAAVLLLAAALLAYTPSRTAIAGWINLHTTIHRVEHPPSPSPLPSGPLGSQLSLGTPTTLADAQSRLSWKIALPASLGTPDAIYLQMPPIGPSGGEVTLVYASRSGIKVSGQTGVSVLVTEARGKVDENFFFKVLGPDTHLENVTINGHPGFWISGKPHDFAFQDASGDFRMEALRLATNTLVFDDNGTIVRIEGDMTKEQALQKATTLGS
jgi:hypothetical protein